MFAACVRCSYLVVFILWLGMTMTGTAARCSPRRHSNRRLHKTRHLAQSEATLAADLPGREANSTVALGATAGEVQTIWMERRQTLSIDSIERLYRRGCEQN